MTKVTKQDDNPEQVAGAADKSTADSDSVDTNTPVNTDSVDTNASDTNTPDNDSLDSNASGGDTPVTPKATAKKSASKTKDTKADAQTNKSGELVILNKGADYYEGITRTMLKSGEKTTVICGDNDPAIMRNIEQLNNLAGYERFVVGE